MYGGYIMRTPKRSIVSLCTLVVLASGSIFAGEVTKKRSLFNRVVGFPIRSTFKLARNPLVVASASMYVSYPYLKATVFASNPEQKPEVLGLNLKHANSQNYFSDRINTTLKSLRTYWNAADFKTPYTNLKDNTAALGKYVSTQPEYVQAKQKAEQTYTQAKTEAVKLADKIKNWLYTDRSSTSTTVVTTTEKTKVEIKK